jgi:transcription antitermination factor NusG
VLPPDKAFWFAIQVVPQHENKVSIQLRHKGEEEFLPMVSSRRKWSDRSKLSERPLFPGYVFCKIRRSSFGVVLGTPGVYRIVSFGGHAHPIADEEITGLMRIVNSGRNLCAVPYFSLGQKVEVTTGPLSGVTGVVARLKGRDRLIISVGLLMRSVAVDVAMSELTTEIHVAPRIKS